MLNFIASWRRERNAIQELARLSDRELADVGIARRDIRTIATLARREAALRVSRETSSLAPSWGAHARRSVAA